MDAFLFLGMNKFISSITAFLFFVSITTHAQISPISLGAKIGINQGRLTDAPQLSTTTNTGSLVGGVFARIKVMSIYAQPEVLLSQRRGVFKDDSSKQTVTNTLTYIDVPILIGVKFLALRINAGPNFQFLAAAKQVAPAALKDNNFSKSNFNSMVVGYQIGIGADIGKIVFDVRYDASLGNLGKKIATQAGNTIDYSTKASMIQLTIGYKLLK